MAKFRKKPVEIEAIQFKGAENMSELDEFMGGKGGFQAWPDRVVIPTLEGLMTANVGDWVIRGIKGEFYPCKPDIFETTCDSVE